MSPTLPTVTTIWGTCASANAPSASSSGPCDSAVEQPAPFPLGSAITGQPRASESVVDELDRLDVVVVADHDDPARGYVRVVEQRVEDVVKRCAHPGHEPRVRGPGPTLGPSVQVLDPLVVIVRRKRLREGHVEMHRSGPDRVGGRSDDAGDGRSPVADPALALRRRGHVDRQPHVGTEDRGLPDRLVGADAAQFRAAGRPSRR